MDGVLQPLTYPVHGKCHIDDQADDLGGTASAIGTGRIGAAAIRLVGDIYRDQRDGKPRGECHRDQASDGTDQEHVPVGPGHIDRRLQHDDTEGNARDPADEADGREDAEDQEHDPRAPLFADEIVNGGADGEDDVENARDPDKLLGEISRAQDIGPRERERDAEDKDEQDQRVGVQREGVGRAVDTTAIEALVGRIFVDRQAGNRDIAQEDSDELRIENYSPSGF